MGFDRCDQQVGIAGPPVIDLVVDDDLIFRLLQLDHLAELGGLAGLAFANDLRRGLEQAEELAFGRAYRRGRCAAGSVASPCRTSGTIASSSSRSPSSAACCKMSARPLHARGDLLRRSASPAPRPGWWNRNNLTVARFSLSLVRLTLARAARAISSTRSFTLRLRSRSLAPSRAGDLR